jgi:hypothetical protein
MGVEHLMIAPDGSVKQRQDFAVNVGTFGTTQWGLFPDPLGGSAVVYHYAWVDPTTKQTACLGNAARLDASGQPRGALSVLSFCRNGGVGISGAGQDEMLVIEPVWTNSPTSKTHWVSPGGAGLAPKSDPYQSVFFSTQLVPLLDGSLVLSESGKWTRHYAHLADQSDLAPGWLVSRPGFTFRNTMGAKGYALLPPAGQQSADCSQRVEILAPSGRLCGTVTLSGDGGSCATGAVDQGWDGTLVQQGRDRCTWRIWPRVLAGG